MKVVIINDVHVGNPLTHQGVMRAASHLAKETLPELFALITKQHAPDLLINLGDLIRSSNLEEDIHNYRETLKSFGSLKCPTLHLVGNHELKRMSIETVESLWQEGGFAQKSYGIKHFETVSFLWLGLTSQGRPRPKHLLPAEQLHWLRATLPHCKKPLVILTHCALDRQDVRGNFFHEEFSDNSFFLENAQEIQEILSTCNTVFLVLQGHLHYFHAKYIDKTAHITCPAMGDNICAPSVTEHFPEVYSVLTLENALFTVKSYARRYCFAGFEGEIRASASSNVSL